MRRGISGLLLAVTIAGCGWDTFARRNPALPAGVRMDTAGNKRAAFAQAYDAYRHGDLQQALPIFNALVSSYSELADYHLYFIGVINRRLGRDDAAAATFVRLLHDYPQSVQAPAAAIEYGRLLVRAGRADEVRPWLASTLAASDTGAVRAAHLVLAEADESRGEVAGAYAAFMEVRRGAPGSVEARTAKQHVQALRSAHPELVPVGPDLLAEARLRVAERDDTGARDAVEQLSRSGEAARASVDPTEVLRVLADALAGLGQTERALAVLREIGDRYPSSAAAPDALFRRASLLWNRDRDAEALQAFEDFRGRYPQHEHTAEVLYAIGRIHEQAADMPAALQAYADLARLYPQSKVAGEARWRVGWIHYRARDWSAAAASFAALADQATSPRQRNEAAYWQARSLEYAGHAARARGLYQQIVDADPSDYYAMWAEQRLDTPTTAPDPRALAALTLAVPEPQTGAPPPVVDPFHAGRWQELKAAGVYALARAELAAIERAQAHGGAARAYLLHAYQTVDGYAAALRMLQRLNDAAVTPSERDHLLYPLAFWAIVTRHAQSDAVDPLLIEAVMRQESLFDPNAVSSAGARGLMQVMPDTAERVGGEGDGGDHAALMDPDVNIRLGIRELSGLLTRFNGDLLKTVAAYNGGAAAVEKWEHRFPDVEADEFVESITYRETRDYVKRVVSNYRRYRRLYGGAAGGG